MSDTFIDPNYRVDWYRSPIDRERLAELNQRSDLKGFIQAGGFLLILIATGSLAWFVWKHLTWPWLIPALFLHGTVSAFCVNAMHELVHGTVFKTKQLNSFFAGLFSFHYWQNHLAFWASHSEHHKFTLHDPHDQEVVVPMELTLKGFLRTLLFDYAAGKWVLQLNISLARGRCVSNWGRYLYGEDPRRFAIFKWSRFVLAGHAAILVISLFNGWYLLPILTSCTPLYGRALQFLLNETQHVGLQDHVDDFRLNSRTFKVNPIVRFIYWHMNWHIEHHMFAGVPCYNLHKLHKEVKEDLPYVWKNPVEMWFHIITCLYRQKYEPGYVYIPELPGGDTPKDLNASNIQRSSKNTSQENQQESLLSDVGPDGKPWLLWECSVCGFVYDERLGLPSENIAPGTRWEEIPDDWRCPDCGVAKADFDMVQLKRGQGEAVASSFEVAAENGPIVILGSGQAGVTVAREYRALNRKREVILVTADSGDFYGKPSLSNALSEGRSPEELILKSAADLAEELHVTLKANCEVTRIDRERNCLITPSEEISYSKLVLATGSDPVKLPLEGTAADQVLSVNHLDHYRNFREKLAPGHHVAILGAGLVGCEFANDLQQAGYQVTLIDPANGPLSRLVPPQVSAEMKEAFARLGISWRLGESVSRVDLADNAPMQLTMSGGDTLTCDLVLSAVGIRPRSLLAQEAGLDHGKGIQVNACMRSSDEHIYALGDCAEIDGKLLPYILPITHAAKAMARSLAGEETEVTWPAMPVLVKTPAFPLVILPTDLEGDWSTEGEGPNLIARQRGQEGSLSGFVLSGDQTHKRQELLEEFKA